MSGSRSLWFKREHSPLFLLRSSIDRARSTSLETLLAVLLLFAGKTCVTLPFELESLLSKTWETILVHSPRKAARLRSYFSILTTNGEKSWKSMIPVCVRSAVLCKNLDALHFEIHWIEVEYRKWIDIELKLNRIWISLNWHELQLNFFELTLHFIELTLNWMNWHWIQIKNWMYFYWSDIEFHWIEIELHWIDIELKLNFIGFRCWIMLQSACHKDTKFLFSCWQNFTRFTHE